MADANDPLSPDIDQRDTHPNDHQDKSLIDVDIEPPPESTVAPQILRAKWMVAGSGDDATRYLSARRLYRKANGNTEVKGTAGTLAFPSMMDEDELVDFLQALADVYGVNVTIERDFDDWLEGSSDAGTGLD